MPYARGDLMTVTFSMYHKQFTAFYKVQNIRVFILFIRGFRDTPPGSEHDNPVRSVESNSEDNSIPASRNGFILSIRLMIQTETEHASFKSKQVVIGAPGKDKFRLMIGLAKRPGFLGIIDLPA